MEEVFVTNWVLEDIQDKNWSPTMWKYQKNLNVAFHVILDFTFYLISPLSVQYSCMRHFGGIDIFGKSEMTYYSARFHQKIILQK